jgi:hypothetical protein
MRLSPKRQIGDRIRWPDPARLSFNPAFVQARENVVLRYGLEEVAQLSKKEIFDGVAHASYA